MDYGLEDFQPKTKTDKTKEYYLQRSYQLIKKAKKELNIHEDSELDVRQLVIWLSEHKKNINTKSWRNYKSSIVYYLENYEKESEAIEALEYIKEMTSIGALNYTEKTSSLKLKKITFEDWQKLDSYLADNKWHKELKSWLRASIITGLRPVEWKNTQFFLHEGRPALKILNAKSTNGRGNGEQRTLLLDGLSDNDLQAVKNHLTSVRTFNGMGEYDYFYKGCSRALNKACRICWPRRKKHITLYSTRHQFSANAKSSGFSKSEVAAMMGHAVDITATMHYGRKEGGNEQVNVLPIEDEVSRVRKIDESSNKDLIDKKQDNLL